MIISEIKKLVAASAQEVCSARGSTVVIPPFEVSAAPAKVGGDLAANVALTLAKQIGESPQKIAAAIAKSLGSSDLVERADVAGPGFVNVWLSDTALKKELESLLSGERERSTAAATGPRTLIEFVSANPTGPLHVGHGRGAALGDSLVRIHRYLGHDVTSEFYINDAGGQIRNLGLSMEARLRELKGEPADIPENGYKGAYVIDIAKEAVSLGKTFKPIQPAQMTFTPDDAAGFASARILKIIQKTLADFGVSFDNWYSETSLHQRGAVLKLINQLREKGHVFEQDNAVWFRATEFGDEKDRVLQKGNEAPTYFAADMAYHEDKFSRGFEKIINIWGADHHGYAQRLKGAMSALGRDAARMEIIFNQMISIKGGEKMSKRAGDIVSLQELVDEVGKDATRFFFALRSPGAHYEFDIDLAKKRASDNPVFYVQYVHARCCSIFREAEKKGFANDVTSGKIAAGTKPIEPEEKNVLLHLSAFDRTVETCAKDGSNHHLTVYLLDLAGRYHSFYEKCHVLVEDASVRSFRLGLVDAIRRRVAQGLDLLGVSAPEQL
jgi:arginyl-tRNA synthetase